MSPGKRPNQLSAPVHTSSPIRTTAMPIPMIEGPSEDGDDMASLARDTHALFQVPVLTRAGLWPFTYSASLEPTADDGVSSATGMV
jgi:hypothetical protein